MTPYEQKQHAKRRYAAARRLEAEYLRGLRKITRHIDGMVRDLAENPTQLQAMLWRYGEILQPWAQALSERIVYGIAKKDADAWTQLGADIGRNIRAEIQSAPTGQMFQKFMAENVSLITSLPQEAAQRVHRLVAQGMVEGRRAEDITKDILQTGPVTESRARLIARTEVARAASGLTMARAEYVGSTHYIWRTSDDSDVRDSHKKMNGKVIAWADPPTLSDGTTTHAGMIYNCRCYPEPILPKI